MKINSAVLLALVVLSPLFVVALARYASGDDEGGLQARVKALEMWKASAERRIKALEAPAAPTGQTGKSNVSREGNRGILIPTVSNKRLSGNLRKAIYFDVQWTAKGLKKPARAIKGVLVFGDLFGESQFRIKWTLNDPMKPGGAVTEKGVGSDYNQFINRYQWMAGTDLKDMTVWFEVASILYADGTTKAFSK